jgi:hypothetical protein
VETLYDKYKDFVSLIEEIIALYKKLGENTKKNWRMLSELMRELALSSHID